MSSPGFRMINVVRGMLLNWDVITPYRSWSGEKLSPEYSAVSTLNEVKSSAMGKDVSVSGMGHKPNSQVEFEGVSLDGLLVLKHIWELPPSPSVKLNIQVDSMEFALIPSVSSSSFIMINVVRGMLWNWDVITPYRSWSSAKLSPEYSAVSTPNAVKSSAMGKMYRVSGTGTQTEIPGQVEGVVDSLEFALIPSMSSSSFRMINVVRGMLLNWDVITPYRSWCGEKLSPEYSAVSTLNEVKSSAMGKMYR
ncbi:hypothetical protein CEXT_611291 [Caerostris extrusa]|uniref:Uncharacterized protein n=1 Tax=Caerostris extrusa TaxID=172846 RepID=A0AAV4MI92_CAEEX|nr:hypothetical protein CEXT_611291 [Caerostris extrusa]